MNVRRLLPDRTRLVHLGRRLGTFLLGQGATQLLSLITGFAVIRWLSVESYAQYSVAFSFQNSVGSLIDLGFSSAIVALVGQRVDQPGVIGRYVRSVLHFRTLFFFFAAPVAALVFAWLTGRQGWSLPARVSLFASVLFSLFFQGWGCYAAPLTMHHRYGALYRTQVASAIFRLVSFGTMHLCGLLPAPVAAWINSISMALLGVLYRRDSRDIVAEPPRALPEDNREIFRYASPLIPTTIFYAFEGQITIFLITLFGRAQNIAEIAVLGRLTQALIILLAFNVVVVQPYIARLPRARLAPSYLLVVAAALGIAAGLLGLSIVFPAPLLWIIGPKYAHLRAEIPWAIAGWGVYFLITVVYTMNAARKWVYWWHSGLQCTVLVAAQVVGIKTFDLSNTLGVLKLSLLVAFANLAVQAAAGVYGFCVDCSGGPGEAAADPLAPGSPAEPWQEPEAPSPMPAGGGLPPRDAAAEKSTVV